MHIDSLAGHTTLNIQKPMEINLKRSPQHYAQARARTRNVLLMRTIPEPLGHSSTNKKIVNFLDFALNLNNGSYRQYHKQNDKTMYISISNQTTQPVIIREHI